MNTKCLVTFKTILEMGSFQKAADKLGYTQSTVTFQIRQLEEEFSLKLFEKIGRHMELTQAGREINQSVMEGSADLGINCEKDSYPDTVINQRLGSYQAVLVASPFADRSQLDFITPHQRKPFSLICNEPDGYYQLDMDKYLAQKDIVLNPHMKVQSIEAVKRCVMNNLGMAVVPTYSIGDELKNGSLIPVKTELDEKIYHSFYIYNRNKWISPQMELAIRLLNEYLGRKDDEVYRIKDKKTGAGLDFASGISWPGIYQRSGKRSDRVRQNAVWSLPFYRPL